MATPQEELEAWLNGTPDGGPNGDGYYPLTRTDGSVHLVLCPAAQEISQDQTDSAPQVFVTEAQEAAADAGTARDAAQAAQLAAETAKTGAEAARDAAALSKTAAATSATNAGTSEANAGTKATAAAASADTATAQATAAGTAKTAAEAARDAASASATAADGSKVAAAGSATAAATSKTGADTAKAAALAAQGRAETAATNAEASQGAANSSAVAADASAQAAAGSATAADASATAAGAAQTAAETAKAGAEAAEAQAGTYAQAASDSADAAAASATSVSDAADVANTAASNASASEGNALAAQTAAESAADTAVLQAGDAEASAQAALASETAAGTSESNAAASAAAADASAQAAGTSETNAAGSASTASQAATDAANARDAAAASAASINPTDLVHVSGVETITGAKTFGAVVNLPGITTSGAFTGAARNVFNLTNTDTTTASSIAITMKAGSGAGMSFGYEAPEYTGVAGIADSVMLENSGTGGLNLSAYGGGGLNFMVGAARTRVFTVSNVGLTALTNTATVGGPSSVLDLGGGGYATVFRFIPRTGAGSYISCVQADDALLLFGGNAQNTGNLVIGSWNSSGWGLRFTNSGEYQFNRPGTSPAGSYVSVTSPGGNPGIIGMYSTTKRRDIHFSNTGIQFAVSSGSGGTGAQFTFGETGNFTASGSVICADAQFAAVPDIQDANGAGTYTRVPRFFVQSGDPGVKAFTGDVWGW